MAFDPANYPMSQGLYSPLAVLEAAWAIQEQNGEGLGDRVQTVAEAIAIIDAE